MLGDASPCHSQRSTGPAAPCVDETHTCDPQPRRVLVGGGSACDSRCEEAMLLKPTRTPQGTGHAAPGSPSLASRLGS